MASDNPILNSLYEEPLLHYATDAEGSLNYNYGNSPQLKNKGMTRNKTINVKGTEIVLFTKGNEEYISITDIARYKNADEPKDVVKNWMRSRSTVEFLG